jgi:hypothetical protein
MPEDSGVSGREQVSALLSDRHVMGTAEPQRAPEKTEFPPAGMRYAERVRHPEAGKPGVVTGKPAERMFVVDLPLMMEPPERPAAASGPAGSSGSSRGMSGEISVEVSVADNAPEATTGTPSAANASAAPRETQEPPAGRQPAEALHAHGVKEHGAISASKEGHAPAGKVPADQVVKHVALQVRGEMSEMRIRLDPPSLGEMQVTIRVDEGRMQAQIDVSQPAVRTALETQVPQLRQSLADHGIEVHRIEVCTSGSSMSRESGEGHGHRPRKREGGRQQGPLDGVEQYRGARMMGYNTIEMVM